MDSNPIDTHRDKKSRERLAFWAGIVFGFGFYYLVSKLANMAGLITYVDFDEQHMVYSGPVGYEVYGGHTEIGFTILFAAFMLSWKLYHWIELGKLKREPEDYGELKWRFLFFGVITFSIVRHAIIHNLEGAGTLLTIALVSTLLIPLVFYKWWMWSKDQRYLIKEIKKAESGSPYSQFSLGKRFSNGDGVRKNKDTALYWYKKSYENPDSDTWVKNNSGTHIAKLLAHTKNTF